METDKRIPDTFSNYGKAVVSNSDGIIEESVAKAIKGEPLYAAYPGWNFHGTVWWEDGKWHCEVWVYHSWETTFSRDTLPELVTAVCDSYGYD